REKLFNRTGLGFYTDLDVNGDEALDAQDCIDGGGFLACHFENSFDQIKTSYAAYTDLSYEMTEKIILRGGLRYTHDRGALKNFISQMSGPDGELIANLIPGSTTDLFATTSARFRKSNMSGKVGVDFKPNRDTLVYVTASRGYRGNSFNAQAFFVPDELSITKPETIDALEIGAKGQLFDRRVQLSGAVFAYNYKNQQYLSNDPDTGVQRLGNLPKTRIYGAELEVTARPVDNLRLTAGLGLLHTRVRKGMLQGENLKGKRLPTAPPVSLSAAADWTVPLGDAGSLLVHVDGSHAASQHSYLLNQPFLRRRALTLLNSRVGYRTPDEKTEIAVWMKNITNEYYFNSRLDASGLGFIYNHIGDPRTYGVTLTRNF
ncbi:MAG: TonB-dependent receptor, partial [Novosphingobium sp.]